MAGLPPAAVVIGLSWSAVALTLHAGRAGDAQPEQVANLAQARITALQARSNELLTLVARGNGGAYSEEFQRLSQELVGKDGKSGALAVARGTAQGQVNAHLGTAQGASRVWLTASANVRELDEGGQYEEAVRLAINDKTTGSTAPAFAELDSALERSIQAGREQFVGDTADAARALTQLSTGWVVLALIAAAGTTYGLRQRLREFR